MKTDVSSKRVSLKSDDYALASGVLVVGTLVSWLWVPLGIGLIVALLVLAVLGAARDVRRAVDDHDRQMEARLWLSEALDLRAPMPPMRGYAMSPDLALEIVEHIMVSRPGRILECGSGSSTLLIGYALQRIGAGKVFALEHHPRYAARTVELIRLHGLDGVAEVVYAPLETVEMDGDRYQWYGMSEIQGVFDLLVIDGPPEPPASRYPAVPLLADRLSDEAVVYLDDAFRKEARRNLARWSERAGVEVEMLQMEKGGAVLRGVGRTLVDETAS